MIGKKISELDKKEVDRARELHKKAIFVLPIIGTFLQHWHQEYYEKLIKGGTTLNNMELHGKTFRQAIETLVTFHEKLSNIGWDKMIIAKTSEDVYRAKKEGKVATFFGTQRGSIIEDDHRLLEPLYILGLRLFGLCYNMRNNIADGCNEITDAGLSAFGQRVVKKCNDLGIVIDLSHVGHQSSLDAIELSNDPVVFSHSNAMNVYKSRRNLYDDQIKAIAERSGVIGVAAWGPITKQLISNEDLPTIEDMMDHLDYFVEMIGVDHVGIGMDCGWRRTKEEVEEFKMWPEVKAGAERLTMSGPYEYSHHNWNVKELRDPENFPVITECLVARGYSDEDIIKILGENFMRVFKKVWDK